MKSLCAIALVLVLSSISRADGLRIGVETIQLRSRLDESSLSKGIIKLNEAVAVREEVEVAPTRKGLTRNVPTIDLLPHWVKIAAGGVEGYVPEGALAPSAALELAVSDGSTLPVQARKVTKGFSDVEDNVALSTMKGAAGKSELGGAVALKKLKDACVVGTPDVVDIRRFMADGELEAMSFPVKIVGEEKSHVTKIAKRQGIDAGMIAKFNKLKELTMENKDPDVKMAMDAVQAMINQSFEHLDAIREHAIGEYVAARFIMKHSIVALDDRQDEKIPGDAQHIGENSQRQDETSAAKLCDGNAEYKFLRAYIQGLSAMCLLVNLGRPSTTSELNCAHRCYAEAVHLQAIEPNRPEPYLLKGQILTTLGDCDRAESAYRRHWNLTLRATIFT